MSSRFAALPFPSPTYLPPTATNPPPQIPLLNPPPTRLPQRPLQRLHRRRRLLLPHRDRQPQPSQPLLLRRQLRRRRRIQCRPLPVLLRVRQHHPQLRRARQLPPRNPQRPRPVLGRSPQRAREPERRAGGWDFGQGQDFEGCEFLPTPPPQGVVVLTWRGCR